MSYEEALRSISLDADASVGIYTGVPGLPGSAVPNSGKQYCFLKMTGKHQVGLATAATDKVVGVLQNKPQQPGAAATVAISGVSNVQVGAAFDAGDLITCNASGQAEKTTDPAESIGVAVHPGITVGSIVPILLDL